MNPYEYYTTLDAEAELAKELAKEIDAEILQRIIELANERDKIINFDKDNFRNFYDRN